MKNATVRFAAVSLLAALLASPLTVAAETAPLAPAVSAPKAKASSVEIVFAIDTTGSMGGLIEGAKAKVWSIINDVLQQSGKGTTVRVGLVAYRDRKDAYVTQVTPLSDNLDEVYANLMSFRAQGGGDTPEDVRMALRDALEKTGWSKPGRNVSQIIFLVGDAPPHDDYEDVPDTAVTARKALEQGILVNTIQCGLLSETTPAWKRIAQYGGGEYFAIAQSGGVRAISTPFDEGLSQLGRKMGGTYLAFGSSSVRMEKKAAQESMEMRMVAAAKPAAQADRAVNKALNVRAYDDNDLLQQIQTGKVQLRDLKEDQLPDDLRAMTPEERQVTVDKKVAERKTLQARILELSKQREAYIAEQRKKEGSPDQGFDAVVAKTLTKQIKANP